MSYYRKEGFRIERTASYDEEKRDFKLGFKIIFRNLDRPVIKPEGIGSKEEAEELAKEIIENNPEYVE